MENYLDYFKNKTVLITGSNGFMGRHLIKRLLPVQTRIIGLDLRPADGEITGYYCCDLRDFSQLKEIIDNENPELVFHLASIVTAARDYSLYLDMLELNVKVLYDLYTILQAKTGFKLLVNIGSTEEYGDHHGLPCREDFFEKTSSPYAASKTAGTHFLYLVGKNEGFPVITIRPGVIFGHDQPEQKFIPYIIKQLVTNQQLNLTGSEQTRDFISINQFLDLMLLLISSGNHQPGEIYNIASGISIKLKEIVLFLNKHLNSRSALNFTALPYRTNEIMDFRVSIEKIKSIVDFTITKNDIMKELLFLATETKKHWDSYGKGVGD